MNESRRRPVGDTEGELRRMKMQVFYLACRETFRGRTPTPSEDRLLHELREALALSLDHARRLGRLARSRGEGPELRPTRLLTRARVQGLARKVAEASGLPRPRWWRHHLLLRASLRLRGQGPAEDGAGFVAQLDQGVEVALFESLAAPPDPGQQAPSSWISRARRGLGALVGLALALQGTSWLIGDLTSTRQQDPSAPQRLSLLMVEAQQEAGASEAERARLGAELGAFRQDPTDRGVRQGREDPV